MTCPSCGEPGASLCRACSLKSEIGEIPELVADLEVTVTRQTRGTRSLGGRSGERPLPFDDRPQIEDARRALGEFVVLADRLAWEGVAERLIALTASAILNRDYVPAARLAAEILTEWALDLAGQGASSIDRKAIEVVHVARTKLRAAIDRPPTRLYAGPCGVKVPALVLTEDSGVITPGVHMVTCEGALYAQPGDLAEPYEPRLQCRTCGTRHTVAARHSVCLAAFRDDVLPMPVIVHVLALLAGVTLDPGLVRAWRYRGRIRACMVHGVETYRVSEVMGLALAPGPGGPKLRRPGRPRARM
jgi:hypothetical protein